MLKMKKVILLFILTMKSYDYDVSAVYSVLQNFREQYNLIFMQEYCKEFEIALQTDNFTPLVINDEEDAKNLLEEFPLFKRGPEAEKYPRTMPFSLFVPKVFQQAKQYLRGCLGFMENLRLNQTEIEDTIRNSANRLMITWSLSLKAFVSSKSRSLVQVIIVACLILLTHYIFLYSSLAGPNHYQYGLSGENL